MSTDTIVYYLLGILVLIVPCVQVRSRTSEVRERPVKTPAPQITMIGVADQGNPEAE
jgi:hypothetical protein